MAGSGPCTHKPETLPLQRGPALCCTLSKLMLMLTSLTAAAAAAAAAALLLLLLLLLLPLAATCCGCCCRKTHREKTEDYTLRHLLSPQTRGRTITIGQAPTTQLLPDDRSRYATYEDLAWRFTSCYEGIDSVKYIRGLILVRSIKFLPYSYRQPRYTLRINSSMPCRE